VDIGQSITIWTARVSAAVYLCALVLMTRGRPQNARLAMTAAAIAYLVHVCCAFQYFYAWSHAVALRETARQTDALFGVNWGGGLYLNYLFTALWVAHCARWWRRADGSLPEGSIAVHTFLVFMFVNATIVVWVLRAIQ
jgi:hypothetical protein